MVYSLRKVRIHTDRAELHSAVISARSAPDIQIRDTDLHQKRHFHRFFRLRLIHHLSISIEHLISRILISAFLRVIQDFIGSLLALSIRPDPTFRMYALSATPLPLQLFQ